MGYLYHGSSQSGIKTLEPRTSTHGSYVYATPNKELTIIFSGRAGDDLTYTLFRNSTDEPWQLVERIPSGFETMFTNSASIYTLSDASFKNIKTGFAELVSETAVDVIQEEKIDNVYQKLTELNDAGIIKMYHYPDRPNDIPLDDHDLIDKTINQAAARNKPLTQSTFARLLLLHPHLLEKVNSIAQSKNQDFPPFQKEDLVDIFSTFAEAQLQNPTSEFFLNSAYQSLTTTYPDLTSLLQETISNLSTPTSKSFHH